MNDTKRLNQFAGIILTVVLASWLTQVQADSETIGYESTIAVNTGHMQLSTLKPTYIISQYQLEMSGHQTFSDYWHESIFFHTISWSDIYLDGRLTIYDIQTLPILAIKQIEVWVGSPSTSKNNNATGGAINIVLKSEFKGGFIQVNADRPTAKGADGENVTFMWGSDTATGNVVLVANHQRREGIVAGDRDYSKSVWKEGGEFKDTFGVSVGGNTVFNSNFSEAGVIGDCSTDIYTGILLKPFNINGEGCGFPWANHAWLTDTTDHDNLLLKVTSALDEDRTLDLDLRYSDNSALHIHAPAVGLFDVDLTGVDGVDSDFQTSHSHVFHRFVANGDRTDRSDHDEFELSLAFHDHSDSRVNWSAELNINTYTERVIGSNYVLKDAAQNAIQSGGGYNLANPLSNDPDHLDAVDEIDVQLTRDVKWTNNIFRTTVSSSEFQLGDYPTEWVAGIEFAKVELKDIFDKHRQDDNVIGSYYFQIDGRQRRKSLFGEYGVQLRDNWNISMGLRGDRYSNIDSTLQRRIASELLVSENLSFRASRMKGERSPSMSQLYADGRAYPKITDTKTCAALGLSPCPISYQVKAEYKGNSNLDPIKVDNFTLGTTIRFGSFLYAADYVRTSSKGIPVASAQAIIDIETDKGVEGLPEGAEVNRRNNGYYIVGMKVPYLNIADADTDTLHMSLQWNKKAKDVDAWSKQVQFDWSRLLDDEFVINGVEVTDDSPRDRTQLSISMGKGDFSGRWSLFHLSGFDNRSRSYRFKHWITHNLTLRWNNAFGYEGLAFRGGVLNIADREPSTDWNDRVGEEIIEFQSPRGRTFFLNVEYQF